MKHTTGEPDPNTSGSYYETFQRQGTKKGGRELKLDGFGFPVNPRKSQTQFTTHKTGW